MNKLKHGVQVIEESGYNVALYGLSKSFGKTDPLSYADRLSYSQMEAVAHKLAGKGGGHDKFLRQMGVAFELRYSRRFLHEFTTYIFAIHATDTIMQSESTMHTLKKTELTEECFMPLSENSSFVARYGMKAYLLFMKAVKKYGLPEEYGSFLIESFLQGRVVTTNYACIANIFVQRYNHKIHTFCEKEWRHFCLSLYEQLEHPELLSVEKVNGELRLKKRKGEPKNEQAN